MLFLAVYSFPCSCEAGLIVHLLYYQTDSLCKSSLHCVSEVKEKQVTPSQHPIYLFQKNILESVIYTPLYVGKYAWISPEDFRYFYYLLPIPNFVCLCYSRYHIHMHMLRSVNIYTFPQPEPMPQYIFIKF